MVKRLCSRLGAIIAVLLSLIVCASLCAAAVGPNHIDLTDYDASFYLSNQQPKGTADGVLAIDIDTFSEGWKFESGQYIHYPPWDDAGTYDAGGQEWLDTSLDLISLDVTLNLGEVTGYWEWQVNAYDGGTFSDYSSWLNLGDLEQGINTWHFDATENASVLNHLNDAAVTDKTLWFAFFYPAYDCHVSAEGLSVKGQVTPEPCSLVLLGLSLPGIVFVLRRRRAAA